MSYYALATLVGPKETPGTQGGNNMKGKKEDTLPILLAVRNFCDAIERTRENFRNLCSEGIRVKRRKALQH
jgi:hypothetical protein